MRLIPREALLGKRLLNHYRQRERDDFIDVVKIKLFITKRCNLRCEHCGIGEAEFDGSDDLSTDQVIELWRNNPKLQLASLSGGEPFIRDDLTEVGRAMLASLPRLLTMSVNTNGWYTEHISSFAESVTSRLGSRQNLFITVSSDGPAEAHARVRSSDDSFRRKEETLTALRRLAERRPKLKIRHNINVNPWNIEVIEGYIDECEAKGETCFVSLYSASKHYSHTAKHHRRLKEFRQDLTQRKALLQRLAKRPTFLGNRFLTLAEDFYETYERRQPVPCFSLRATLIVEHDGMVRPCINFPVDLGRVQDHGYRLEDIANGPKAESYREKIRTEKCPICWTPNEAYVTMMCNLPNPTLWKHPTRALVRLGRVRQ